MSKIFIAFLLLLLVFIIWKISNKTTPPSLELAQQSFSEDSILTEIPSEFMLKYKDDMNALNTQKLEENKALWNDWIETGYQPGSPLTIDYYFYSASENNANTLTSKLQKHGFQTYTKQERTLVIFKGYVIKTQIRKYWDFQTFHQYELLMSALAEKEGTTLEGVAAKISK